MAYIGPQRVVEGMVEAGSRKALLGAKDMLTRGFLSGALLGYATSLALTATAQTGLGIVGALVFPVGFVMIVLLGLELVTGNFAMIPVAALEGRAGLAGMLRNFAFVFAGNLLGGLAYAALLYIVATKAGSSSAPALAAKIAALAEAKTLGYLEAGPRGALAAFTSGVLCNWMVSLGAVLALSSASVAGKTVAMWLPILTFFAQGYEHSVVNMFVIPAGMMFGADVGVGDWWFGNQIVVTLGNFVGGAFFTGVLLYMTHGQGVPAGSGGQPGKQAAR